MKIKENVPNFKDANTIEIHYWLKGGTHLMDAYIQNKCEHEFLGIIREIALKVNADIIVETEPFREGGLRRWFKVVSKEENKKGPITQAAIVALITVILSTPISKSIEKVIDKVFEDVEMQDLEKEKIKLEIKKLRQDLNETERNIGGNVTIKKRRSNFYSNLSGYPDVDEISIISQDNSKTIIKENRIKRNRFSEFILVNDDIEPIEINNAIIEIISPVLKKGNYSWMGVYEGNIIHFKIKSAEFKSLVQSGKIQFKNGTSIDCQLIIHRAVDNEGVIKVTKHEVIRVNSYFENDKPVETPEGKSYRQKREADKSQYRLFDDNNKN
ncbi:MAG TPA: hypothetical protein VL021_04150 [Brumimicrobium sp.]|nr:hypothetical protein [Brumimicrobium sp.]